MSIAAWSIVQIACAILAWDFGMRWLADRANTRIQENVLGELAARLDNVEAVIKRFTEQRAVR